MATPQRFLSSSATKELSVSKDAPHVASSFDTRQVRSSPAATQEPGWASATFLGRHEGPGTAHRFLSSSATKELSVSKDDPHVTRSFDTRQVRPSPAATQEPEWAAGSFLARR